MTPHQQQVLTYLRNGGFLESTISGWYYKHSRMRVETQDALEATNELAELSLKTRLGISHYIVHRDCVDKFLSARPYKPLLRRKLLGTDEQTG